jgi:hypothetical protein
MENFKTYNEFINEATTSWKVMMRGVDTGGPGPWSIVAIEYNKVVAQELVKVQDGVPAGYEAMRKKHPKSRIRVEDSQGKIVFEK